MKPIIEVRNLSKQYKIGQKQRYLSLRDSVSDFFKSKGRNTEGSDFWALDDVSFDVHAGESIGIIGRNGAGKSTLLKILSRITPPTKGKVILRGRIASLLEVGTGFHSELTGRENVFMNGSILGLRRAEIAQKFDEIVAFSGVEQFLDTPLKHYSSGMQLRLAFAVAAHLEPEILVIDEVLAVGDAEFQKKCLGKMDEVSKSGRTVLFVSHQLESLRIVCSHGILLDKGQIMKTGDMDDIINAYKNASSDVMSLPLIIDSTHVLTELSFNISDTFDSVKLSFNKTNTNTIIKQLSLLIYTKSQIRIGIIDFRPLLINLTQVKDSINLEVKLKKMNLVEDTYNIGVFIETNSIRHDFFNVIELYYPNKTYYNNIIPYDNWARGIIDFRFYDDY